MEAIMKKIGICENCKKERVIFYSNICQKCYRYDKYFEKEQKIKKHRIHFYKGKSVLAKTIIETWTNSNMNNVEVYKEILDKGYTSSYQYVCKIIKDFGKII